MAECDSGGYQSHQVTALQGFGAGDVSEQRGAKDQSCPLALSQGWSYAPTSSSSTLTGGGGKERWNTTMFHSGYSSKDAPLES